MILEMYNGFGLSIGILTTQICGGFVDLFMLFIPMVAAIVIFMLGGFVVFTGITIMKTRRYEGKVDVSTDGDNEK